MNRRRSLQWGVRLVCLIGAVLLAAGGPLPAALGRVVPALSPLVLLVNTLTGRQWYVGLFWSMPAIAVLLLAVWRGRLFCRWICPAGTLYSVAGLCRGNQRLVRFRFAGVIFWMTVAGACIGLPLWLFMDPLSSFTRLVPLLRGAAAMAALVPGLLLPLFLLLSVWQPLVWCAHFCPLGYLFDLCHMGNRGRAPWQHDRSRRDFMVGVLLGAPLALTARAWVPLKGGQLRSLPVLPPGAGTAERFAALCTRCYACVDACPTRVIKVGAPVQRILGRVFQPELDTRHSFCREGCTTCSQVCPSGALQPLSEAEQRRLLIGCARVRREACVAWADNEVCMVCSDVCPYGAITSDMSPGGIPRPVVMPEVCRGCGLCQVKCPVTRTGERAVVVSGIDRQQELG